MAAKNLFPVALLDGCKEKRKRELSPPPAAVRVPVSMLIGVCHLHAHLRMEETGRPQHPASSSLGLSSAHHRGGFAGRNPKDVKKKGKEALQAYLEDRNKHQLK